MSTALFCSLNELKRDTVLTGNIDGTKLLPSLSTAQELEIEPILGSALYDKISDGIINNNLVDPYLTLKQKYILPVLVHYAVSYYIPYSAYVVANGGTVKYEGGENHSSMTPSEVSFLVNKERSIAENFKTRLISHLTNNSSDYPEYSTGNTGEDITPSTDTNLSNWYLG
jgi:hypothetical protein